MRMSRERRGARPPLGCGSSGTWLKTWLPLTLCGSIPLRLLRNYFRQCPRPRFFGDFGTHVMATLCGPICRLGCGTTRSTFISRLPFLLPLSFLSFLFPRELGLWRGSGIMNGCRLRSIARSTLSRFARGLDKGVRISNQSFCILSLSF